MRNFTATTTGTVGLSVTAVSASIALPISQSDQVEVSNEGPDTIFVRPGKSGVTAVAPTLGGAAGDYPVLAGQSKVIDRKGDDTHIAMVCAAGKTSTGYASCGVGS